jgi:hypothetical protein
MARSTYGTRLEALIANPAISSRDKSFAESLLRFYASNRRLSAGRARCVKQLEERYSPEKLAAALTKGAGMLERLNAVCERTEASSWARGFVNSLQGQIMAGRELSDKQIPVLEKIERDHNDEAMTARETWKQDYLLKVDPDWIETSTNARFYEVATIAAKYYKQANYFGALAEKILNDDGFVPSIDQYNKITKNKFVVKVLQAHYAPQKFAAGSLVQYSATAPGRIRTAGGNKIPMVVIMANASPIISAAKGAKIYKVLPIGSPTTRLVEERHLKKARKAGGKK